MIDDEEITIDDGSLISSVLVGPSNISTVTAMNGTYISNNDERIQELEERIKILEAIVLNHQAAEMKNI